MTAVDDNDAEYMRIKRLYEIVREGSATTRDFYAAYKAERKKEDERRREQHQKPDFYFVDNNGLKCFNCVFCGQTTTAQHATEHEYWPEECAHPTIKTLGREGVLCSDCFNWDFDVMKRNPPRKRDPLKHRSGRLLTMTGWLDQGNDNIDKYFG